MNKFFVIGDVHGCYDELINLIELAEITEEDTIIALGDIVDRGNKSKEVYQFLRDRKNTVVLMGNHERKHLNGLLSYAQEIVKLQFGDDYQEFIEWLSQLDYYYETDEVIIVHAAFEHDKEIYKQREDVLSGTTSGEKYLQQKYGIERYWTDFYEGKKPIIYGHHVVGKMPKIDNKTYGIDTGACHGGHLTAIEIPGFKIHQVKARCDHWKKEQEEWQIPILKGKDWNNMEILSINKQLEKLEYIDNVEVKAFLKNIQDWLQRYEYQLIVIKSAINELTNKLVIEAGNDFNASATNYTFSRFIFMSRSGKLTINELYKALNTPNKIKNISQELNICFEEIKL